MSNYQDISAEDARNIVNNNACILIDIRDEKNYALARIPRAIPFDEPSILRLRKTPQRHTPILVYCYHGHSSKDIATLLCSLGFTNVYNLAGGYEAWRAANEPGTDPA
jgi:thiosulfate sulfurtransferase